MKFTIIALLAATASAQISEEELFAVDDASPVGTACKTAADTCGDATTMCCGTGSNGHVVIAGTPPT